MSSKKSIGPSEAQIENEILTFLSNLRRGFWWKNTSAGFFDGRKFRKHASPFAINGTSDIFGVVDGRLICFEVKTECGRPTPEQVAFIKKVQAHGALGAVVRSVAEVRRALVEWELFSSESCFVLANEK
jgi:penicillin-binding protein-related factor A (putative recombinase)